MKKLLILSIFLVSGAVVMAQSTPVVNQTQKTQSKRIVQGAKSGELTKRETKELVRQQKRIKNQKRVANADGKVTKRERARIRHSQAHANKNIRKKKNNNADRIN